MQADKMTRADTDTDFAVATLRRVYGFEAAAERLPGEYDDNFRMTSATGARTVLKIAHPDRDQAFIDMQCAALEHLAHRVPHVRVPEVVRGSAGEAITVVVDPTGRKRLVWMLRYIEGRPLGQTSPQTKELRHSLGNYVGRVDAALMDFDHPAAHRDFKWNSESASWILAEIHQIRDPERRKLVERMMRPYEEIVAPALPQQRRSVIHGDANEWNVLTRAGACELPEVLSMIDYGDMHFAITLSGLTTACAYGIFGQADPIAAAADIIAGYHDALPIRAEEFALLYPLIAARLCVSVVTSAIRSRLTPDDPYLTISEAPAWEALERMAEVPVKLAHARFRAACGLAPTAHRGDIANWLAESGAVAKVVDVDLASARVLDLSLASLDLGADPDTLQPRALARWIGDQLRTDVGVGRYLEVRLRGTSPGDAGPAAGHGRTHLGMDLFVQQGTEVRCPLPGSICTVAALSGERGGGSIVVLRHELAPYVSCFSVYAHLATDSVAHLATGSLLAAGALLGRVGGTGSTAEPAPHVHIGLFADLLGLGSEVPLEVPAPEAAFWAQITLDPNLLLGIPVQKFPHLPASPDLALARRRNVLGGNLSISYRRPLKIVRGWKQYLYDESGRAYLDVFNNVPLVGHSHPRVVAAATRQLGLLNTNTRYLHDNVLEYAERLTALMPAPLRVCYFLNSASEANELALRMARTVTGRRDVIVLDHAYHGHTNTLIDISPYKFNGPGGAGGPPWVHVAPVPDDYRGAYRRSEPDVGRRYAAHVAALIDSGVRPGAFIAETLPSVGGQIVLPPGYLSDVYGSVRKAGGVCIADEVQVGFGRLGSHFWGFSTQDVVPDMVILGKPIGNAFPLAALVTTPAIAAAFNNGMEFFSTFGGNPVASAVGLAVLDVLRDEGLPENALRMGSALKADLTTLISQHPLVGDVRGLGLFLGVELVRSRETLEPADTEATYIVNRLREEGILAGTDGPFHNVLKIRPPLCVGREDAARFTDTLARILGEDGLRSP